MTTKEKERLMAVALEATKKRILKNLDVFKRLKDR
jgi:hypothetical protein